MLKFTITLLTCVFLVACGAERDAPFNPSGGNNSSSAASTGAAISLKEFYRYSESSPAQPVFLDSASKQIFVASTEDEFEYYWDIYNNGAPFPTDLDFATSQVVILDLGNIGNCTQITQYRNLKAYDYSSNTVLVSFNYREKPPGSSSRSSSSSSTSCNDLSQLAKKRPFYFYKIDSRKKILIDESVTYE